MFILRRIDGTMPPSCSTRATSRCSGVTSELFCSPARFCAPMMASWAFSVYLLRFISLRSAVLGRAASAQSPKRFVVFPFLRGQLRGHLHLDAGVQVTLLVGFAHGGHAIALQPEYLSVLCEWRDAKPRGLAGQRLHIRLAAEHGRRHRHGHTHVQVAILQLEGRMRCKTHSEVQMSRLTTADARFALTADAHA